MRPEYSDQVDDAPSIARVVADLEFTGMTSAEASVFVHLSVAGASKAGDVAKATGLSRPEAYRVLNSLVDRGFVEAEVGRPIRYHARSPDDVFESVLAAEEAWIERLREAKGAAALAIGDLASRGALEPSRHVFKLVQGRREIFAQSLRMVQEATREVRAVSTLAPALGFSDFSGVTDAAVGRAQDGLRLKIVLLDQPGLAERLTPLAAVPNLEIRGWTGDRGVGFIIADGRNVMASVVADPSPRMNAEGEVSLWTDAVDFAASFNLLFDSIWERATPLGGGFPTEPWDIAR